MRSLILLSGATLLAACNQVNSLSDADKKEIDCLASIAVVEITDYISAGGTAGKQPDELVHIVPDKIAEATAKLETKYNDEMSKAYLEFDINNRLTKFERAVITGDPESEDFQVMADTVAMGRSCTFGS